MKGKNISTSAGNEVLGYYSLAKMFLEDDQNTGAEAICPQFEEHYRPDIMAIVGWENPPSASNDQGHST